MASTDQSGITGSVPGAAGHWHDGSWYTNEECRCALAGPQPERELTADEEAYLDSLGEFWQDGERVRRAREELLQGDEARLEDFSAFRRLLACCVECAEHNPDAVDYVALGVLPGEPCACPACPVHGQHRDVESPVRVQRIAAIVVLAVAAVAALVFVRADYVPSAPAYGVSVGTDSAYCSADLVHWVPVVSCERAS